MADEFRAPREDVPDIEQEDAELGMVDIVFVIDTTGSMGAYIGEAQRRAREEAARVAQSGALSLRFGLVAYRDHPPEDTVLIDKRVPLGDDAVFQTVLLSMQAVGGGDEAEAVWDGLNAALAMSWRARSERLVFLIGDAPPHGYSSSHGDAWPQGCPCGLTSAVLADGFRQQNIRIDAVSIANNAETTRAFTEVAEATGGRCTVVERPAEQSAAFASSMRTTSDSVTSGRILLRAMRVTPDASVADLAASTGMTMAAVNATQSYLDTRGFTSNPANASADPVVVVDSPAAASGPTIIVSEEEV